VGALPLERPWRRSLSAQLLPDWLKSSCEFDHAIYERAGALYDSWRAYAHERGQEPGSPAQFAGAMEARGFEADEIRPVERHTIRWGLRLL
jgi:hypothetical protein